jgi:hypothetical protein
MATSRHIGRRVMVGLCVAALAGIAFWTVASYEGQPDRNPTLEPKWKYDMSAVDAIDPQLIQYVQVREIPTGMDEPRGIAVAEGSLYIAGDGTVVSFDERGERVGSILALDRQPQTIFVASMTEIFMANDREVFRPGLKTAIGKTETLITLDDRAVIVSLAVTEQHLFLSDAGNRVVLRYNRDGRGEPLKIGEKSDVTGAPGLVTPSPYLDILIDRQGLLRVVNPGKLRVETYSLDGDYGRDSTWGVSGPTPSDFVGCCNPVHIAQLPDGRFVTSEKGSPRVKIYSEAGEFECVVAGPEAFSENAKNLDLATDADGRIYVLDAVRKSVRIFARKL